MGMHFLEELVKKRYQLGNGVVSSLKGFLLANQDVPQYAGNQKNTFHLAAFHFLFGCYNFTISNEFSNVRMLGSLEYCQHDDGIRMLCTHKRNLGLLFTGNFSFKLKI